MVRRAAIVSRKGWAVPAILTAGDMLGGEWEKCFVVGGMWLLVGSCERSRMRDVGLDVRKMGREEGFMALERRELRRALRRDMTSFKQKAISKDVMNPHSEMCIL